MTISCSISGQVNVPHGNEAISSCRDHLSVVGREAHADNRARVGTTLMHKLSTGKIVNAEDAHSTSHSEVFVIV